MNYKYACILSKLIYLYILGENWILSGALAHVGGYQWSEDMGQSE